MIIFYSIPVIGILVIAVLFIAFGAVVIQNIATLAVVILVIFAWIINISSMFDEDYGVFSSFKSFLSSVFNLIYLVACSYLMLKFVKLSGKNGASAFFIVSLIIFIFCSIIVLFASQIMTSPFWSFVATIVSIMIILVLAAWSNGYTNVSMHDYKLENVDHIVTASNYDEYDLEDVVLLFEYELNENGEYSPKPYVAYNNLDYDIDYSEKSAKIHEIVRDSIAIENGTELKLGDIEKYSNNTHNKKYRYIPVEYQGKTYALFYYTKSSGYDVKIYFKDTYKANQFGDKLYKMFPFTYSHSFSTVKE